MEAPGRPMHALITAFAAELRRHPHPSAATAAALLDRLPAAVLPPEAPVPAHLAEALGAPGAHPLTGHLAAIAGRLPWVRVTGHDMPAGFAERHSYCDIAGPGALIEAPDIGFGAYLQFPDTFYPRHWHAAEELYFILGGTALWTRDEATDAPARPGTLIRHAPFERHATRTQAEPLLALWVWMGDLDFGSYRIDPE